MSAACWRQTGGVRVRKADKETPPALGQAVTQERVGLTGTLPPERVGLAGALPRETVLAGRISLDDEALKCINMKHDAIMIVYKL